MRYRSLYIPLLVPLLSAVSSAQYLGEAAGRLNTPTNNPNLTQIALSQHNIVCVGQMMFQAHSSLPPGTFYTVMSVQYGTCVANGFELASGTYNVITDTLTKNTDLDGVNVPAGDDFQGSVSADLRVVVWDSPTGVKWATRPAPTGAFTTQGNVSGITSGYVDPQLGMINGTLVIFYASGTDITVGDFNPATGLLSNQRLAAAKGATGTNLHSPTPLNDKTGASRALFFSNNLNNSDSDAWFNSSVEGLAPSFENWDSGPGWVNNPGAIGGRVVYSACYPCTTNSQWDNIALSSASVPTSGGNLTFSVFMPPKPSGPPYIATVLLGQLASAPIPHPFLGVPLSINPANIISLPSVPTDPFTGDYTYSLPLPPLPPGLRIYGVPVGIDVTTNLIAIGNTAYYSIK